ncbi:hypothetical protein MASR2M117_09800 [Paludibacter sp.]
MNVERLIYEDALIAIGHVEEDISALINQLKNFEDYRSEYLQIKTDKRRMEFLAARILLNELTGRNVLVEYRNDKPFLKDNSLFISITHSKDYVAVITHHSFQTGIDLEIRNTRVSNIIGRFLNIREQKLFCLENSKIEIAWSAKEALYKIIGNIVRDFAAELEIFQFELNESGVIFVLHTSGSRIYKLRYYQNQIYTLVVCVDKKIKL